MASTSSSGPSAASGRIRNAAITASSDYQSLIADVRRSIGMMKEIAVDLERENQSRKVKELENAVIELLRAFEDSLQFSNAIQLVGDKYQPSAELTDFNKLIDDEIAKLKANSSFNTQNYPLVRQFREAVWNVHHAGQPMPGDEEDDIVMTSTQCNLLNIQCPVSGKPVTQLAEPVRSVDCKHIYERQAIMHYLRSSNSNLKCPVAACPKTLDIGRVVCDPLLLVEIEEMRSMSRQTVRDDAIEDCTAAGEDDSE